MCFQCNCAIRAVYVYVCSKKKHCKHMNIVFQCQKWASSWVNFPLIRFICFQPFIWSYLKFHANRHTNKGRSKRKYHPMEVNDWGQCWLKTERQKKILEKFIFATSSVHTAGMAYNGYYLELLVQSNLKLRTGL